MCGIIGVFGKDPVNRVLDGLSAIENRGKDGAGVYANGSVHIEKSLGLLKAAKISSDAPFAIGHVLHSIVGHCPQPLIGSKGVLAINCEIYNWKELCVKHSILVQSDSELVLKLLEKLSFENVLEELDGVYSFAYLTADVLYIARDIIGEKPLWYAFSDGFLFASEKKSLVKIGAKYVKELNPRTYIVYSLSSNATEFVKRPFFKLTPLLRDSEEILKLRTKELLESSILKMLPDKCVKVGLLFSGGVDSMYIAHVLKKNNVDFTCYTAALKEEGLKDAEDVEYARRAAAFLGVPLKIKYFSVNEAHEFLKIVVPLIEDTNATKVGVALTFYACGLIAKEDGVRVIYSGLGSEEVFAGYERHKKSADLNQECLSGFRKIYEKDLYRDDVITMYHSIELRLPFLSVELAKYALRIPEQYKFDGTNGKLIFRKIAEEDGIPAEFAWRKKRAAQYGSNTDKAIEKLAHLNGTKYKSEYLAQLYADPNRKVCVLLSSGKDSLYAAYLLHRQNYELSCALTLRSLNSSSYMFHTPNIDLAAMQAEAMKVPFILQETKGDKEEELNDLKDGLIKAIDLYNVDGVVTGALFSVYQRERIEKVCEALGIKVFSPLWHMDQKTEVENLLKQGFEVIISSIAADGFNSTWLGRKMDKQMISELSALHDKNKINVAGEGGEYESLVLDCPLFKQKIKILESEKKMDSECSGVFVVNKAELVHK